MLILKRTSRLCSEDMYWHGMYKYYSAYMFDAGPLYICGVGGGSVHVYVLNVCSMYSIGRALHMVESANMVRPNTKYTILTIYKIRSSEECFRHHEWRMRLERETPWWLRSDTRDRVIKCSIWTCATRRHLVCRFVFTGACASTVCATGRSQMHR